MDVWIGSPIPMPQIQVPPRSPSPMEGVWLGAIPFSLETPQTDWSGDMHYQHALGSPAGSPKYSHILDDYYLPRSLTQSFETRSSTWRQPPNAISDPDYVPTPGAPYQLYQFTNHSTGFERHPTGIANDWAVMRHQARDCPTPDKSDRASVMQLCKVIRHRLSWYNRPTNDYSAISISHRGVGWNF